MFYVSLIKKNITKKQQMNELSEFEVDDDKEYKVKAIQNSAFYAKKANVHLLRLYYLVIWKSNSEKENNLKPLLAVMHFWKMVNIFHKNYLKKPTVTPTSLNSTPPMAKPAVTLPTKRKQGNSAKSIIKCIK